MHSQPHPLPGKLAAALAALATLSGCATPPPAPVTDPRMNAALEHVRRIGARDRWYGLYDDGVKVGYRHVSLRVSADDVEITSRVVALASGDDGRPQELTQELYERFETAAPGHATMLRVTTEGYGQVTTASIERRGDSYVARSDDRPAGHLAAFQFTLADRFAPHVWLAGRPAPETCLAYPDYDLDARERTWLTECVAEYGEREIDGATIPFAVTVQLEGGATRAILQRAMDGSELHKRVGPKSVERAEPEAMARALPGRLREPD